MSGGSLDQNRRSASTLLLGRRSYDLFRGFWPAIAEDPSAKPVHRELARLENAIEKVVVSGTISPDQTTPWRDTTEIVRRAGARERIAELKRAPGRDILVFASRRLWNDLLEAGLVHEFHLVLGSVVLGAGTPAFAGASPIRLRRLGIESFEGSDNVLVRHAPVGAA